MPKYEELNETQQRLYDNLSSEIEKGAKGNITPILEEIKEKGLLKEVLTANITKEFSFGMKSMKRTLTPLSCAINAKNQEGIKAILDVAEKNNILKEVFAGIERGFDREELKEILGALKNQEHDEQQGVKISGWLEIFAKTISGPESSVKNIADNEGIENNDQKDTVKTTNKPIIIGNVCGAIAALAVGGGLFAAGVALPILAIIGIAIAAAVVVGLFAGGIIALSIKVRM